MKFVFGFLAAAALVIIFAAAAAFLLLAIVALAAYVIVVLTQDSSRRGGSPPFGDEGAPEVRPSTPGGPSCLILDDLQSLSGERARELAKHEGDLYLRGLTELSDETAEALAEHKHALFLQGLNALSLKSARSLAQHRGKCLLLCGLSSLSETAAEAIASYPGELHLNGLTAVSVEVAEALARHEGWLSLKGVTSIPPEAARALSQHKGMLSLDGLTALSDEAAKALSSHEGGISLCGLTELTQVAARALAQCDGSLNLPGIPPAIWRRLVWLEVNRCPVCKGSDVSQIKEGKEELVIVRSRKCERCGVIWSPSLSAYWAMTAVLLGSLFIVAAIVLSVLLIVYFPDLEGKGEGGNPGFGFVLSALLLVPGITAIAHGVRSLRSHSGGGRILENPNAGPSERDLGAVNGSQNALNLRSDELDADEE